MKNLKLVVTFLMISAIISSCSKDDAVNELMIENETSVTDIDPEIEEYLQKNGLISIDDEISIINDEIFVGDMVFDKLYIESLISQKNNHSKQLAFYNPHRMDYSKASEIIFFNGIPNTQPAWRTALIKAVNIWNDTNLCLNVRIRITNAYLYTGTRVVLANAGDFSQPTQTIADARIPKNGRAGNRIRINYQQFNASNTTEEAMINVLVHEIGHTLGYGHTRLSQNNSVTFQIPGTASGRIGDINSIMWASASTNRTTIKPFSNGDIIAARALFPSLSMNKQQYNLSGYFDQITTVDHNGDGREGFAVYAPSAERINFYDIQGNGFDFISNSDAGIAGFDLKSSRDRIISLDYDGDNDDDLCLYRPGAKVVFIARSDGNGKYTNVVASFNGLGGFDMRSNLDKVISFDYNGDGKDDLCFYRPGSKIVFVARSNGNGTFSNIVASFNGLGGFDMLGQLDRVISFDYNGDGKDDLCFYRPGSETVFIARSNGNGTFSNVVASFRGLAGFDMKSTRDRVIALDYNGDGNDDLCFYRPASEVVYIARSNGNATFTNVLASHNGLAGFDMKSTRDTLVSMDYDNDGDDDICFIRPGNKVIFVARSNGDGTFTNLIASHTGVVSNYTGDCID